MNEPVRILSPIIKRFLEKSNMFTLLHSYWLFLVCRFCFSDQYRLVSASFLKLHCWARLRGHSLFLYQQYWHCFLSG